MNRRRIRRYHRQRGNSGVKFLGIVGIMLVAVICGYMTARFVIAPLLGYDTEVLKLDFPSKLTDVFGGKDEQDEDTTGVKADDEDDSTDKDAAKDAAKAADEDKNKDEGGRDAEEESSQTASGSDEGSGYALQFGLFSTRARAQELADKLEKEGIDAEIKETEDGQFKVLSPLADTKEEALETLKNTESDYVDDIFITKV